MPRLCPMSGYDHAHCTKCGAEKTGLRYCDECDATGSLFVYADEDCDLRGERGANAGAAS